MAKVPLHVLIEPELSARVRRAAKQGGRGALSRLVTEALEAHPALTEGPTTAERLRALEAATASLREGFTTIVNEFNGNGPALRDAVARILADNLPEIIEEIRAQQAATPAAT